MQKEILGIPQGRIVYTDLDRLPEPLFSAQLGLVGRPDYIVQIHGKYIPVEVKSAKARKPCRNHVLQLGAYCLLIEQTYGQPVPFGVLVYDGGRQFTIPFVDILREQVIKTLEQMRIQLASKLVTRNHDAPAKCKRCPFRKFCNQKIL